ncbi:protein phosphatase [Caldanaerovirga acetigignens]|uniref:Protein phosphatase n=1 Tax=Caldanaerovirga acetigignens TaxID=447595 RepID=A0A1M7FWY6_9FIRM|nr:Stp1/IreP family PP2C-type Ser/Thr phosphatase [Caldanaerovirga acetigignens]SHM08551.1 protein phosphatase [Caldanaerovirga acetigignens]
MIHCAKSDRGRVRPNNEDAFYIPENMNELLLFIVADGMGGHNAGEVASRLAVEEISSFIKSKYYAKSFQEDVVLLIKEAFKAANEKIYTMSLQSEQLAGMGTTATLALFNQGRVYIGHVGDSRAYMLRGDHLRQLTKDHSLVWQLMEEGRLTAQEIKCHPMRNIITRALGVDEKVDVDVYDYEYKSGDIFLLCSDGLTNMLDDEKIREIILNADSIEAAAERLVQAANNLGGHDNITVELILVD